LMKQSGQVAVHAIPSSLNPDVAPFASVLGAILNLSLNIVV